MEQYAASLPPRRRGEARSKATPPIDFAQGREPVERQIDALMVNQGVDYLLDTSASLTYYPCAKKGSGELVFETF